MTNVAILPALALLAGAAAGVYAPLPIVAFVACAAIGWITLTFALLFGARLRGARLRGAGGSRVDDAANSRDAQFARPAAIAAFAGFFGAGAALAADATREALTPPILADTHAVRVDVAGASGALPVVLTGVIRSDASPTEFGAMFSLDVETLRLDGAARVTRSRGAVRIAVGGTTTANHIDDWRAGRRVRVTATLAAPQPYLNIGTPNQETRLALAGIRLFGSVKSASQVELLAHGHWWDEAAASTRAYVRRVVSQHVRSRQKLNRAEQAEDVRATMSAPSTSPTDDRRDTPSATQGDIGGGQSVAITTAILIGDRAGLDQEVEERLQRAGTFHVIAISGGNIAILTALILGVLRLIGFSPRLSALLTLSLVGLYAFIVGSGASVARAALAAIIYLFARTLDHRTPSLNVLAVVVTLMLICAPLEIVDAGFWLTCLATLAIILLAQRITERASIALRGLREDAWTTTPSQWIAASSHRTAKSGWLTQRIVEPAIGLLAATAAAEAVLLPVTAYAFSQVSIAGLLLNFLAIPLMTVVQVAGIAIVLFAQGMAPIANLAGMIVDLAAGAIVSSSRLVDTAPWSASRVAPPPLWLLLACQACLCAVWFGRPPPWLRRTAACAWLACLGLIVWALPLPSFALHAVGSDECQINDAPVQGRLRVTFLDVAQGDATLIRFPDGRAWLVDTGGALGRFDIGSRIVSPALWALGLRQLSTLVLTHGDRDHIGGAHSVLRDFRPGEVWEGVPVKDHVEMRRLKAETTKRQLRWRNVEADEGIVDGDTADGQANLRVASRVLARSAARAIAVDASDGVVDVADVDVVDVRVWHPPAPQFIRTRVRNDDSIVMEVTVGNVSIILPGDIEAATERMLTAQGLGAIVPAPRPRPPPSPSQLAAPLPLASSAEANAPRAMPLRVLKAPHHGSKTSSTAVFLNALQPRIAIVSAGRGNRYGHPAPVVMERYDERGTEVFRTDRDGAIQLETDGHTLTVRTCSGRVLTMAG